MPRYYFHVRNGTGDVEDEEGRELPDLDTARLEALKGARSIVADGVTHGHLDLKGEIEIVGEDGRALLTITFGEAVGLATKTAVE